MHHTITTTWCYQQYPGIKVSSLLIAMLTHSSDCCIFLCLMLILQKKYWSNLKTTQKIAIMDILFSFIEFAASYNSYSNLRTRMNHISAERLGTKQSLWTELYSLRHYSSSNNSFILQATSKPSPTRARRNQHIYGCLT